MADRYLLLINIFKCSSHNKTCLKNVCLVSSNNFAMAFNVNENYVIL